jgi:Glutathione S-transferase, C-terminal domain
MARQPAAFGPHPSSEVADQRRHPDLPDRVPLRVLGHLIPASGFVFGAQPSSIDAAIYGFIASNHFYEINTPLRDCVRSQPNVVRHYEAVHAAVQA